MTTSPDSVNAQDDRQAEATTGVLWVDAVGGFLVCLGDEVQIGQSTPEGRVEIPLLADVSRRHCSLCRGDEGYVVQPHAPMKRNGIPLTEPSLLFDRDEITLGKNVRLRFRLPNPLSNTASLHILSGHRTQPSTDGILLLGTTLLLGPNEHVHVQCPHWKQVLTISRTGNRFRFRTAQPVDLNGTATAGIGTFDWNMRLSGEDFALKLERC